MDLVFTQSTGDNNKQDNHVSGKPKCDHDGSGRKVIQRQTSLTYKRDIFICEGQGEIERSGNTAFPGGVDSDRLSNKKPQGVLFRRL